MKYSALAFSAVLVFQFKLSTQPCQALTLKYLCFTENASKRCGCVLVSSCTVQWCWHHLLQRMPPSPTRHWCPGLPGPVHVGGLRRLNCGEKTLFYSVWLAATWAKTKGENRMSRKCSFLCVIKNCFYRKLGHLAPWCPCQKWRGLIPPFFWNNVYVGFATFRPFGCSFLWCNTNFFWRKMIQISEKWKLSCSSGILQIFPYS